MKNTMQVKQQFILIVLPKIFNVLNFYSKGIYSIEIVLLANDEKGNIVYGFPFILQNSDAMKSPQKKAKVLIKQDKVSYVSENFYVTFSADSFHFKTIPYFKIELERQKKYKIQLQFNLQLTSYKINNQKSSKTVNGPQESSQKTIKLGQIDEKVKNVVTKRVFLNNLTNINTYHKIIFTQPDYFSYSDIYLLSTRSKTSLRRNCFDYYQFNLQSIQQRSKNTTNQSIEYQKLYSSIQNHFVNQIKSIFKLNLYDFYHTMIKESIQQYQRLTEVYQNFRALMCAMNNSTIIQKIRICQINHQLTNETQSSQQGIQQSNINNTLNQTLLKSKQQSKQQKQLKLIIQLQQYYQTTSEVELYLQIINQHNLLGENIKWLISNILLLLSKINYNIFNMLCGPSIQSRTQKKFQQFVIKGQITSQKKQLHQKFVCRRSQYCKSQPLYQDWDPCHPFIMLQGFDSSVFTSHYSLLSVDNLVVFVHGYQGSDYDLEIAKYMLEMVNPNCFSLLSTSVQDDMDQTIQFLGLRLAQQVKEHINRSFNNYKRINFVGYSLGGILIRQSIKHLQQYKDKMNLFITLASPHVGTVDGGNYLIKTGIWYLINFQNAKNIKQLHCQFDTGQSQQFVLKTLSQCQSLRWFTKMIVVSSQQDSFVPYNSSRIDQKLSSSLTKIMCQNINKRVKKLERVQVRFDQQETTGAIDKILGRRAHIEFLENRCFLRVICQLYKGQF